MREIRFRGKRVDNGEWVYGDLVRNNEQRFIFPIFEEPYQYDQESYEVIPETVGQLTNRTDIHNEGIYEGDIIQFYRHSDITHKHEKTDVSEIKFSKGSFVYTTKHGIERPICSLWNPGESMEIIANIHDNPDLIKKAN